MAKDTDDDNTDSLEAGKAALSPGAALAAQRKIYDKNCVICGQPIKGTARKTTCSDKCRKAKSRLNKQR